MKPARLTIRSIFSNKNIIPFFQKINLGKSGLEIPVPWVAGRMTVDRRSSPLAGINRLGMMRHAVFKVVLNFLEIRSPDNRQIYAEFGDLDIARFGNINGESFADRKARFAGSSG